MKKTGQILNNLILFFLLLVTALPAAAAGQNSGEQRSNSPVTKIDLGIRELTMEVGDSYTFRVTYEPENTARPYRRDPLYGDGTFTGKCGDLRGKSGFGLPCGLQCAG